MLKLKVPRPPGPASQRLKVDMEWSEAMKKMMQKKRPKDGWPTPSQDKDKE